MPFCLADEPGLANLVLQDTVERIFVRDVYADINRGVFIVRGENVLLLGEIVRSFFDPRPDDLREVSACLLWL
jgi:U6 snRNA-associated Sm-like protein LSm1